MAQSELSKGLLEIANKTQVLGWDWWLVAFAVNQRTHDPALQPPVPPTSFQLETWPKAYDVISPIAPTVGVVGAYVRTASSWTATITSANIPGTPLPTLSKTSGTGTELILLSGDETQWNNFYNNGSVNVTNQIVTKYIPAGNVPIPLPTPIPYKWASSITIDTTSIQSVAPYNIVTIEPIDGVWHQTAAGAYNYQLNNSGPQTSTLVTGVPGAQPGNLVSPVDILVCNGFYGDVTGPNMNPTTELMIVIGYADLYGNLQTSTTPCPYSGMVLGIDNQQISQLVGTLAPGWIK